MSRMEGTTRFRDSILPVRMNTGEFKSPKEGYQVLNKIRTNRQWGTSGVDFRNGGSNITCS